MAIPPGPDELRIRGILRRAGVGPDARPAPPPDPPDDTPPDSTAADDLRERLHLDEQPTPAPEPTKDHRHPWQRTAPPPAAEKQPDDADPAPEPHPQQPDKNPKPRRRTTDRAPIAPPVPSPRQSLMDAWDAIPGRLKWLGYHGSAAYLGWELGIVDFATDVTDWIFDHGLDDAQSIFWLVIAVVIASTYRNTQAWAWPAAWLGAVPASSAVVGALLYGNPA